MELTLIITGGVLLGCFLGLSWFAGSDAPYVPTKMDHIRKVLKLAGVKKGKKFYELGSGDGRVVIEAAKLGAESVGIEESWIRVLYSRWKARSNVNFYHGNIFNRTYSGADIIYVYLLQEAIDRLEKKFKQELKKGATIITQTYHFKNLKPYKKYRDFQVYNV